MVSGKRATDSPNAGETLTLSAENIVDTTAPYELVSRMRASFWVVGPLLARMHEARVSLPGGCAIGTRPVDFFLMGLEALGAEIEIEAGYVVAKAPRGLDRRARPLPAHFGRRDAYDHDGGDAGEGRKRHRERRARAGSPQPRRVPDQDGRQDRGRRHRHDPVVGVDRLGGATHRVLPDRIETGTYAMAVAATGGDVLLQGAEPDLLQSALERSPPPAPKSARRMPASASPGTARGLRPSTSRPRHFRAFPPISKRSSWR